MYMTQALHRDVQQRGDAIATVCGQRRRTYRELAQRVSRLAGALRQLGVASGDRVAMLALNSDRYLEYTLACWWAGAVLNPVNTRWSAAEMAHSLNDCDTAVLLIDRQHLPLLPALREAMPGLRHVIVADDGPPPHGLLDYETLIEETTPIEDALRGDRDLAGIFYTGGTTGVPKGVMLSHGNLYVAALGFLGCDHVVGEDIALHVAPLFHLAGMSVMLNSLITGGRHVFIPAFEPKAVLQAISKERVTHLILVPTMLQQVIDDPSARNHDLSSLVRLQYAASPMTSALLQRAMSTLPNIRFVQAYGMTELSPHATVLPSRYHEPAHHALGKLGSVGRAVHNVELRIIDRDGAEVPRGTVGEIVVRGPNVMQGYWKRPQDTAQALRGGWMHTGDGGFMDEDGFVYLADRIKDMIITGGENVYSAEVENILSQHPDVAMCAVIGVPDERWGECVHAFVMPKSGATPSVDELQAHCKARIAGYKCPRSFDFVESLPLSGTGKVLKAHLRKLRSQVR